MSLASLITRPLSEFFMLGGRACYRLAKGIATPKPPGRLDAWQRVRGDRTLRLEYDLNPDSLVLDLGGYEGQWASDIFAMYQCRIHVFEPVAQFAAAIGRRFAKNSRITIHEFGLATRDGQARIGVSRDASSLFKSGDDAQTIRLVSAADFLRNNRMEPVDLMKINIEGGEYDLLEHLIDTGTVRGIHNLQIQFHDFIPQANERMAKIQADLARTHTPTYQYPFVWENWRVRESAAAQP